MIVPPQFNYQYIFGVSWHLKAGVLNPVAHQINTYPALNGTEELNQGLRGGYAIASGRLWGADETVLNAMEMLFRSYYDGRAYVLTDQFGNEWSQTKLESYDPSGDIQRYPDGSCARRYEARFRHLNIS